MPPLLEEARRLLGLARSDRDAFLWLLQGPGLRPASAYFFAQQAMEKALKAVMIVRHLIPGRTHKAIAGNKCTRRRRIFVSLQGAAACA